MAQVEQASSGSEIGPAACFDLFSDLGELKFGQWSRHLNKVELEVQTSRIRTLEGRLRQQISSKHDSLLSSLNNGFLAVMSSVHSVCDEVNRALKTGDDDALLGFDEFDHDALNRRDRLQYALEMSEQLELEVAEIRQDLQSLDGQLKDVLPRVLRTYRESGDFVSVDPTAFPDSFWWRMEMD